MKDYKWDRFLTVLTISLLFVVFAIGYSVGRWFNG